MVEYCCIAAKFTGSMNVMEAAAAIAIAIALALAVLPFLSVVSHLLRLEKLLLMIIETILRRINGVGDQNEIKVSRAECGIKAKSVSCSIKAMMAAAAPPSRIHSGRLLKTLCSSIAAINNVFQNCRRVAEEETSSVVEVEIFEEEEEHDCVICLCKVCKGENYRSLPGCNHGFHAECIEAWLKNRSTCPLCRSPAVSSSSSTGLNKQSERFLWLLDSILISGIISLLNHLWIWFINPLSFDLTT